MAVTDASFADSNPTTCLVLGGRGLVGRSLVLQLLKVGNWIVRIADSAHSLQLDHADDQDSLVTQALSSGQASYFHVDVRDKSKLIHAIKGASVVFYTDASDLDTHDFYHCYMIIVQGAKNVINACREYGVKRLIYNSSADVVFDGSHDICNGDESLPCPWKFEDMWTDLKAQAEALVLFANNIDGLLTCVLRPSIAFGPGDTELVPFLLSQAKSGWAKFIVGTGENTSDFTYVDNIAHAHICAEKALGTRVVAVSGKAFLITNREPVKFWEFISFILEELGYQRPFIKLPAKLVQYILLLVERTHEKLGFNNHNCHLSAQYILQIASRTRTFDCTAAQKDIGYSPIVSLKEGVTLTVESFSHLAKNSSSFAKYTDDEESKADKLLGSGKVAEILLWRDEKKSFICFLALSLLFYWFFLCGGTFISSSAKLLLLGSVILYGYGILPKNLFGVNVRCTSLNCFEISDTVAKDSIATFANLWNRGVHIMMSLSQGEDWNFFFKVTASVYFLKMILLHSLNLMVGVVLVFAFTSFFVYEQYESEIDGLAKVLGHIIKRLKELLMQYIPTFAESSRHRPLFNKE